MVEKEIKMKNKTMTINDWIHVFAGQVILVSLGLGRWVDQNWYFLTMFVGLNLLQYGITKFCPLGFILKLFKVPENRE